MTDHTSRPKYSQTFGRLDKDGLSEEDVSKHAGDRIWVINIPKGQNQKDSKPGKRQSLYGLSFIHHKTDRETEIGARPGICSKKDDPNLALLRPHVAPARELGCLLVHLGLAHLLALLLLKLPDGVPNGLTPALLVHVVELLAALSQRLLPLLSRVHLDHGLIIRVVLAPLGEVPLARPELAALNLALTLLLLAGVFSLVGKGCGGDGGGVCGGG
ncbi:cytochrome P450 [Striga asiatica]|uniref:Cytochrome P450 n=1 Tax=Striga asiatica TaxID=4170 RepID=A0A5A7P8A5_STRAF|nr:cytochrome P450 [Striga asiatica]